MNTGLIVQPTAMIARPAPGYFNSHQRHNDNMIACVQWYDARNGFPSPISLFVWQQRAGMLKKTSLQVGVRRVSGGGRLIHIVAYCCLNTIAIQAGQPCRERICKALVGRKVAIDGGHLQPA